ncbi:hypothetical protein Nmel_009078 [Mimus melanotis]
MVARWPLAGHTCQHIFAFTLGEEFSNWTDRAGAVREAFPLPGEPFICSH